MNNFTKSPLVIAVTMCIHGAAFAQSTSTASPSTVLSVSEVVVTAEGGALSPRQILTSVNVLPQERIEKLPVYSNYELLNQVPGVMGNDFSGKGIGHGTISMRGFNAEGSLNAVKLLIDGIPSNANDGNTYYMDMVPRLDIEAVEVVKGTNDPRYGLHNIAGNVNFVTKQGGNYQQARAFAGSFGATGAQASMGIENDNVSQNYAFGYQKSNGFREHSDADATNFTGKWFVKSDGGQSRVGLIVRHMENQAQEPGYLTTAEFNANPWQVAPGSLTNQNSRRTTQVAVKADSAVNRQLLVSGHVYMNELYDNRLVTFAPSPQEKRMLDEKHVGAAVNATYRMGQTLFGDTVVVGGVDAERQDNLNFRSRVTGIRRDHTYTLNTVGGFIQAVFKPSQKLTITPAYRVDKVDGVGYIRVGVTAPDVAGVHPINDYGLIKQPKLSAAYAISNQLTAYGNLGRTFQLGTGRAAYQPTLGVNSTPSVNDGWETGVKFKPTSWVDSRVAIWQQTASNENATLLGDAANAATNYGKTRREGLDLELNARATDALRFWGGVSLQKAEILSTGKEVNHVPQTLYSLGSDYRVNQDWRVAVSIVGQSSYFVETDNSNTQKAGAYRSVNASAIYKVNKTTDIDLQAKNLTNQVSSYVYDTGYAVPNAPRSFYAGINFKL